MGYKSHKDILSALDSLSYEIEELEEANSELTKNVETLENQVIDLGDQIEKLQEELKIETELADFYRKII
jgi:chaperonin cofactor prefoldin